MEIIKQLSIIGSLLHQVSPENRTQVARFGKKCHYTLNCFLGLIWFIADTNNQLYCQISLIYLLICNI